MKYDFRCHHCQRETTVAVPIADYNYGEHAPLCHGRMKQLYTNLGLAESSRNKGLFPYTDNNLGPVPIQVQSQQHRRQLMKSQGLHDRSLTQGGKDRYRDSKRKHFSLGRGDK